ncbi:MAG: 2-dehydropantoate 2-reductase [Betaproteobacteria bacterium]|nr:2-dehydropantoate 2-reductase [Betaproteobacteria bacterium]
MKIAVWGCGAIGGVAGAGMAAAGEDVLLVDIVPEHINAINERGLLVKFGNGEQRVPARAALPAQVAGTFDVVFLAVKSQYRDAAIEMILPHLTPQSAVVSLQNGVNEPHIARRIGVDRTIGCLVDVSSDYQGPGEIMRGRAGNFFVGELDDRITPRLEEIRRLLGLSVPAFTRGNIMGCVWAKICKGTVDATTALVDTDALKLRADQAYHPVRIQLLREGIMAAAADGVRVEAFAHFDPAPFLDPSPAGVAKAFEVLDEMARGQAHNNTRVRTGYWRDIVVRKRKTELEYVTGEIVRTGARHDVPTPLNALQMNMFDEIESGRREMKWENLAELNAALGKL